MPEMNLVDLVIVVGVAIALGNGFRRGFWLSLSQYLGLVIGVIIGAALAPAVLDTLSVTGTFRSFGALMVLVIAGAMGSTLGYWVGEPIRMRLLMQPGRGRTDSVAGAVFSALAVLSVAWFLGLSLARGPSPTLAQLIHRSVIVRSLDSVAPRPPAFLARVEAILSGVHFPAVFSGLSEPSIAPNPLPGSVDTPGIHAAAQVTVKIAGSGCGGTVYGSGFPVAGNQVLTNAHVVAGTQGTVIYSQQGQGLKATVVLFDARRDVAILYVPRLTLRVLSTAAAQRGTQGAAIGYPGGGPEQISPAVIDDELTAQGRDIYGRDLVVRDIWVIQADVKPGDSGGPLVDRDGNVIGVVFASSTSQRGQAYALTNAEVKPDIDGARGKTQAVDVGQCSL
jgi:S1-C subfamily serine protease